MQLQGTVDFPGTPPVIQWKLYSGPGAVTFGNAAQTNTTANFSAPGVYTLLLSADDGVHAVAYDAVVLTVTPTITVSIAPAGANVNLNWTGGTPPYVIESAAALPANPWSGMLTTSVQNASIPVTTTNSFFRVKSQ
jgi:hypothetical protein